MSKLVALLLLSFIELPQELYLQNCPKDVVDSVYMECGIQAEAEYDSDPQPGTDYLMADWAFGENLLDLSEYCINRALSGEFYDENLKADCLSLAVSIFRLKGEFTRAIGCAEECLLIDRSQGNPENISSSLNNIAGLYLMSGNPQAAKRYIDEALDIESRLKRSSYLAIRYGVASEIYLKLGELEKALSYADEAFSLDSLNNNTVKMAVRRSQKAAVLMEMGKDRVAEFELEKALPVFLEKNNQNSSSITYVQLGEIAARNNNYNEAEHSFNEAIKICKSINHIYMESRARKGLYNLYKGIDNAEALHQLEEYVELQKIIHDEKSTELLQSFSVKYDVLKKEQSIAMQKGKIRWQNTMLSILIVLLILISALLYMSRKAIKVTKQKNAILAKANLDKDRLLAIAQSNIPKEVKDEILSITGSPIEVPKVKMTPRELEIANLCAKGLLNKEIAEKLNISQRTVEVHKNNIFKKLGINNTVELVRYMQIIMREGSNLDEKNPDNA